MAKLTTAYMEEVEIAFAKVETVKKDMKIFMDQFTNHAEQLTEEELQLFKAFRKKYYKDWFHPTQVGFFPDTYMALNYAIAGLRMNLKLGTGTAEWDTEQHVWDDDADEKAVFDRKAVIEGCAKFITGVEELKANFLDQLNKLQGGPQAAIDAPKAEPKVGPKETVTKASVSFFERMKKTVQQICSKVKDTVKNVVKTVKASVENMIARMKRTVAAIVA